MCIQGQGKGNIFKYLKANHVALVENKIHSKQARTFHSLIILRYTIESMCTSDIYFYHILLLSIFQMHADKQTNGSVLRIHGRNNTALSIQWKP